ncbi:hypothetical protein BDR03DRAFT_940603 [Suillus americanus]|nr:hypothetical protein BDR03DRAFT_940603 [Suillus americanus]
MLCSWDPYSTGTETCTDISKCSLRTTNFRLLYYEYMLMIRVDRHLSIWFLYMQVLVYVGLPSFAQTHSR